PAPERLPLTAAHVDALTRFSLTVRASLSDRGVHGVDGAEIDHIELTGPSPSGADCRNFVLCPGGAWDRSPCGTGTSARMACLAADGRLAPGEVWRQESLIGSVFEGSYQSGESGRIHPTLTGTAHVMAEGSLILEDQDPFRWGLRR
ncbi:MAG: proline racemase family protein, partial [Acidobacteriota bacterium]